MVGEQRVNTRRPGAQPGNRNGMRHGAYLQKLDRRARLGKAQAEVEAALVGALGDPSPQETLLLQRIAMKAVRCWILEGELLGKKHIGPTAEAHYLRWARELREDLKTVGFKRRPKPVEQLEAYVKKNYGGK